LALTILEAPAEWELAIGEARLKLECGTNLELEDLCKWPREERERHTFDETAFFNQHPRLFHKYLSKPITRSYVKVKKSRV
jgi:hypothetical protein